MRIDNIATSLEGIEKQFSHLRLNLLDLSMRNRLLNFRPGARSIRIVDEISTEIYSTLVIEEKSMQFLPVPEKEGEEEEQEDTRDLTEEELAILWNLPAPTVDLKERHKDLFLQTKLRSKKLQKILRNTYQQAKSIFEEQGYNVLYLALGFLEWSESSSAEPVREAPLILIPVELTREKVGQPFELSWTGDDILTNISLKSKLEDQGIALPDFEMPEEKEGIYEYFKSVESSISSMGEWSVLNDIYLSFFSFTNFVMYKDLDPKNWPEDFSFEKNEIIKSLFNDLESDGDDSGFLEEDVDKKLSSSEIFNVLDADSSQIAAIEDVKAGKNLVVEGPPGTGKSQTIVNMIAELINAGKKVLFVSEKMAALEVVKERLDQVGLGEFCLELHSRHSNKKDVLNELQKTLYKSQKPPINIEDKFKELDEEKKYLNNYVDLIHKPAGKIGLSCFDLFGMKEKSLIYFDKKGKQLPRTDFEHFESYTQEEWQNTLSYFKDLENILRSLEPLSGNPWRFTRPGVILPADKDEIKRLLKESAESVDALEEKIDLLYEITGVKKPKNMEDLDEAIKNAEMISKAHIEKEIIENTEWDEGNSTAKDLIEKLEEFQLKTNKFELSVLDENLDEVIRKFKSLPGLSRVSSDIFTSYRYEIGAALKNAGSDLDNILKDIQTLINLTGVKAPNSLKELEIAIKNASFLMEIGPVEKEVLNNVEWNKNNSNAQKLIETLEVFDSKGNFLSKFGSNILNENLEILRNNFRKLLSKKLKFLSGDYKKTKNKIQSFYRNWMPDDDVLVLRDLDELVVCKGLRDGLRSSEVLARSCFGSRWLGEDTDPQGLREFAAWLVNFRRLLMEGDLTQKSIEVVSSGPKSQEISRLIMDLHENSNRLSGLTNTLNNFLKIKNASNPHEIRIEITSLDKKFNEYFEFRDDFSNFYKNQMPDDDVLVLRDLDELVVCKGLRDGLRSSEVLARSCFGSRWLGEDTDPQGLREFAAWLVNFRRLLMEGDLTQKSIEVVSNETKSPEISQSIKDIHKISQNLLNSIEKLEKTLNMDSSSLFPDEFSRADFEDIKSQMNMFLDEISKLLPWSQFLTLKKDQNNLTKPVIDLVESGEIETEDIIPCFNGNFADEFLKTVFTDNKFLSTFSSNLHENKIKRFNDLDQELLVLNRQRIACEVSSRRPNVLNGLTPNSEVGTLLNEFNRKRRHMPIRKLLSKCGGIIQSIKPCFMMSPLSIAQFIDPNSLSDLEFDVVIFDEASQVKPENALGAFLRGKQLVVMGDTKQLPPTAFFDTMIESEEEDYELDSLADMESVLHLCKKSFTTKMLRWHYRSRHESLIAVSNHEFYDNKLLLYPSPCNNSEELGLKFEHVKDGVYDRGRSSGNLVEAKAVVKAIMEHYQKYGNTKSLGVGTFNLKQKNLIEDLLEIERQKHEDMEPYFDEKINEKFFVKNIETIQGDERDVILVSVGFGIDENGKLSQNFGPINKDGGERRLNVLFTRAREKCVIFANFRHSSLRIGPNASKGLRSLKTFLEYAETNELVSNVAPREDTDSPFEDSVYEFLQGQGFDVDKQVGCAGFRIDLAVVNSKYPGKYLLGIECDGAMYHSSPVARDRDRLRQQVLEGLGWNIYRIWSTDWYRNREMSIKRLLNAIELSKNGEYTPIVKKDPVKRAALEIDDVDVKVPEDKGVSLEDSIKPYELCSELGISENCELHEKSQRELSTAIKNIVDVEGPVHIEEVIKRIREYWGLKRAGNRIKTKIRDSSKFAQQMGYIHIKGDFLFSNNGNEVEVRRRTGDLVNMDLISPEEIGIAVKMVINAQYATEKDELITQTAHLLGFKSARKKTSERIEEVINGLIYKNEIILMSNGMINFPK